MQLRMILCVVCVAILSVGTRLVAQTALSGGNLPAAGQTEPSNDCDGPGDCDPKKKVVGVVSYGLVPPPYQYFCCCDAISVKGKGPSQITPSRGTQIWPNCTKGKAPIDHEASFTVDAWTWKVTPPEGQTASPLSGSSSGSDPTATFTPSGCGLYIVTFTPILKSTPYPMPPCIEAPMAKNHAATGVVYRAKLKSVTFSGPGFHAVTRDSREVYDAPHWEDNSVPLNGTADDLVATPPVAAQPKDDHKYPITYVRNTIPSLQAVFDHGVEMPGAAVVEAEGTAELAYSEFPEAGQAGPPQSKTRTLHFAKKALVNNTTYPATAADVALPDQIDCHDTFTVQWRVYINGSPCGGGASVNQLYETWAAPIVQVPFYHTVVDIGSKRTAKGFRGAAGDAAVELMLADRIWSEFADRNVRRVDPKTLDVMDTKLRFYTEPPWNTFTEPETLAEMFTDERQCGKCQAWASFFQNCNVVQGLARTAVFGLVADPANGEPDKIYGLLVKNYALTTPAQIVPGGSLGAYTPAPNDRDGIAGQGPTMNPPGAFKNHAVVMYGDQVIGARRLYDPSYGTSFTGAADFSALLLAWQHASLDGLSVAKLEGGTIIGEPTAIKLDGDTDLRVKFLEP